MTNNNIQIFNFENQNVRMQIIEGKEYFCAKDVCDILGYVKGRNAVERHCKKEGVLKQGVPSSSGIQEYSFISESVKCHLINSSQEMKCLNENEKLVRKLYVSGQINKFYSK